MMILWCEARFSRMVMLGLPNIVVKRDSDPSITITGIIDWEDSGFYLAYHECVKLTCKSSPVDEDDWHLYLLTIMKIG